MGFRGSSIWRRVQQMIQFLVGLTLLVMGFVEFFNEPPLFDILGDPGTRPSLPDRAFVSVLSGSTCML